MYLSPISTGAQCLSRVSEKFDLFSQTLLNAIDSYLSLRRLKMCSSDKPWVSNKLRRLIMHRQKALKSLGKDSPLYKELRNKTQVECRSCKRTYYKNKVSNLKDSNSTRWWREIKDLGGLRGNSSDWWQQMLGNEFPSTDSLCEKFNNFLFDLTSHFSPLQPPDDVATISVPEEFLVSTHQAFCSLRSIKVKKSPGPDKVPNRIWKEFAFELAPVVRDLYNTSLVEEVVPCAWKQSIVVPVPKVKPPKSAGR